MTFDEMNNALTEAERAVRVVDRMVERLAYLVIGRLRKVDSKSTLRRLKDELRSFNAHTGNWKE